MTEVVSRVSDGVSVTPGIATQVRIGHFVEAQILEALEIDYIDESEVAAQIYCGKEVRLPVLILAVG